MPLVSCRIVRQTRVPAGFTAIRVSKLLTQAWQMLPDERRIAKAAQISLDAILVDDAAIAVFNADYMRHEGATDVISFPMNEFDPERKAWFLGELIVSVETARREAAARDLNVGEELARYIVHGLLHLVGYDDQTGPMRRRMHAKQEAILSCCYHNFFPTSR